MSELAESSDKNVHETHDKLKKYIATVLFKTGIHSRKNQDRNLKKYENGSD